MGANRLRVSRCGYLMWDTTGHDSFVPLAPHRLFDWENGRAMGRAVSLGDETRPGRSKVHPMIRAPLPVVGSPPKDPRPWE